MTAAIIAKRVCPEVEGNWPNFPAGSAPGVMTVEASFVMAFAVLLIFSLITLSMVLGSHAKSVPSVRRAVQEQWSSLTEEGKLFSFPEESEAGEPVMMWPFGSVSYEEKSGRLFYNVPVLMRLGRIFREDE